jgi:hypothetical protein
MCSGTLHGLIRSKAVRGGGVFWSQSIWPTDILVDKVMTTDYQMSAGQMVFDLKTWTRPLVEEEVAIFPISA